MEESVAHGCARRNLRRAACVLLATLLPGCGSSPQPYGRENVVAVGGERPLVWAVAPAINLSGQPGVDPLLHGDLCFKQMQEIKGLRVIPVDRVVTVYAALGIERVQSVEQAAVVCDQLGVDGLIVPTVTLWEPYNPPKMGASLQLFTRPGSYVRQDGVDPRVLVRQAAPVAGTAVSEASRSGVFQSVGMFDASDGTVRDSISRYAYGRHDPLGPFGEKEFYYSSDRYATFVYRRLTEGLLDEVFRRVPNAAETAAQTEADRKKAGILDGGAAGPQAFPANRR